MPQRDSATLSSGVSIKLAAPTNAMRDSPANKLRHARCSATKDDEHAVSTTSAGPRRSKLYAKRPAAMLWCVPEAVYASMREGSAVASLA
jgi:hypothetical protein